MNKKRIGGKHSCCRIRWEDGQNGKSDSLSLLCLNVRCSKEESHHIEYWVRSSVLFCSYGGCVDLSPIGIDRGEERECTCTCTYTRGVYGPPLLSFFSLVFPTHTSLLFSTLFLSPLQFSLLLFFILISSQLIFSLPSIFLLSSIRLFSPSQYIRMHTVYISYSLRGLLIHHNNRTSLNLILWVKLN